MRFLYTILLYSLVPFALIRLWWRGRKNPAYRQRWEERLGFVPKHTDNPVWVHAVSVGESIAAIPLIRKLLAEQNPVVVTTMTITGGERINALFGSQVTHYYLPYDLPGAVRRFIKRVKPRVGILMETEIWPNLYARCAREQLPIILANARLSPKSAKHYGYFLPLFTPALQRLTFIAAQTQMDADRFLALKANKEKLSVMGNIKFDIEVPDKARVEGQQLRSAITSRPVWIAASTHKGEEELALKAHSQIRQKIPNALLILVPRHPERFAQVAELIEQQGFTLNRRSTQDATALPSVDVFLGDTMGELLTFYAAADVAFVGGSFAPIGGHNVLEPAALAVPAVTGPNTFNFTEIMSLMQQAHGCIQLQNPEQLSGTIIDLLTDTTKREDMGNAAYQVVQTNRGSFARLWEIVKKY
ncbi:MAG: lipid IV(A) 3-deoxy-D-manno-octulosonic acid transferase [Gammaproteobacteria bacterium]